MASKKILDVADKKYLLFDDALTTEKRGFTLTMNPPVRTDTPVLLPDQPWEIGGIGGDSMATVMYDQGVYKLWYTSSVPAPAEGEQEAKPILSSAHQKAMDRKTLLDALSFAKYLLCYATSKDGIHWKKPNLGIYTYKGTKKNNIVMFSRGGGTVFIDPTAPPSKRYKLIHGAGPPMPHTHQGTDIPTYPAYHAIYGAYSADGIHWRPYKDPIIPWYVDTTNVCFWDDRIGKYVAYIRYNKNMTYKNGRTMLSPAGWKYRMVGRCESTDFRKFPPPKVIMKPTAGELTPAKEQVEPYNTSAVKYPYAADSYFIFPGYYHPGHEMTDIHVATSRDGVNYNTWRDVFVGVGMKGQFDSMMTHMATGMVRRDNAIEMYYVGGNYRHDVKVFPPRAGGVGRVQIRLDGFVSQDARWTGGNLLTVPIKFSGMHLEVNMDASAGGSLKVELQDRTGKTITGHAKKDADVLWGNDVRTIVTWKGQSDLSSLQGKIIRLNFIGRGVKLYAFQFTNH